MKNIAKLVRKQWQYHVLLIPGIIFVFIFNYIPLYGLVIAFQKYNPAMGFNSPWVGLANFEYLFRQPNFVRTIWNTFYIAVFKIVGGIIVPVTFALLLNELRSTAVKRVYQTVIYPWTMIVSDIWKSFGFGTVIYLAALTSIDPGLYEAAIVDGAGRWMQTVYITIPMILPTVVLMTVLSLGNVLNAGFDQIYNLYSPMVYKTGDIIDTYVYRLGIQQAQYSIGTAVGMFKSVISGVLICMSYYLADRLAGYRVF